MKVNVRTPYIYQLVFGELNSSASTRYKVGIYNDSYLGSSTDLNTFGNNITREEFIAWMQTQGKYTLYGGQADKYLQGNAGYSSEDEQWSDSTYALTEMPKTHTSYLNSQYNTAILDNKWKNQTYSQAGDEYNGKTSYKYIEDHLGYRFVIRNSQISQTVKQGEIAGVKLNLENVGFGNIVKGQKVSLILRKDDNYYETQINIDATKLNSGTNNLNFYFYVPSEISTGDWNVYLKLANENNSNYAIKFANSDVWDNDLKANRIGKITIQSKTNNETINIKQAFVNNARNGTSGTIQARTSAVPVTFVYLNQSNNNEQLQEITKTLDLGTVIDFGDASSLSNIEIGIPAGYTFSYAKCEAITGDQSGYDIITIPNNNVENNYTVNVYIRTNE